MEETYPALIQVKAICYNDSYKENLPFRSEPNEEETKGFLRLIRPTLEVNFLSMKYICPLTKDEI